VGPSLRGIAFFQSGFFECWSQRIRPHCVIQTITPSGENSGFGPNTLSNLETPELELLIEHANEERVVHWLLDGLAEEEKQKARLVGNGRAFLKCADFNDGRVNRHLHHHVALHHLRHHVALRHLRHEKPHRLRRHSCGWEPNKYGWARNRNG
jgi:hypothetical protein